MVVERNKNHKKQKFSKKKPPLRGDGENFSVFGDRVLFLPFCPRYNR